jgi:hypothetical protein
VSLNSATEFLGDVSYISLQQIDFLLGIAGKPLARYTHRNTGRGTASNWVEEREGSAFADSSAREERQ